MAVGGMTVGEVLDAAHRLRIAARHLAEKVWPLGFDTSPTSETRELADINRMIGERGRLTVWSGASDHTIFGDEEANWSFRAWHDWTHWRYQLPFTLDGERMAAERQADDLIRLYSANRETVCMIALLFSEVVGQAEALAVTGSFVNDQVAFALSDTPRHYPRALAHVRGAADRGIFYGLPSPFLAYTYKTPLTDRSDPNYARSILEAELHEKGDTHGNVNAADAAHLRAQR